MTDGQSFYLVLAAFYLLERVKLGPIASFALVSPLGGPRPASPRQRILIAWGLRKSVFIAPLLPWPSLVFLASGASEAEHAAKPIRSASGARRWARFLTRATAPLRRLSLLIFLNFFAVVPFLYGYIGDGRFVLAAVAAGYASLLIAAGRFHRLHRRLFPSSKAERLKLTFYTAVLPWHAMACADELLIKGSLRWSPLAALAANAADPRCLDMLKRYWRDARHRPNPPYRAATLESALRPAGLDPQEWLSPPAGNDSPLYCPCCHSGYNATATRCADCAGVPLLAMASK